jgi:hypothetical protein
VAEEEVVEVKIDWAGLIMGFLVLAVYTQCIFFPILFALVVYHDFGIDILDSMRLLSLVEAVIGIIVVIDFLLAGGYLLEKPRVLE